MPGTGHQRLESRNIVGDQAARQLADESPTLIVDERLKVAARGIAEAWSQHSEIKPL